MNGLIQEVHLLVSRYLYEDLSAGYTDVQEWTDVQTLLAWKLAELEQQEGTTPEEEGELVLAILMGYTVAIRNANQVTRVMERAERVLPLLSDDELKCQLAVFCYGMCPDEELERLALSLLEILRKRGKHQEVLRLEKLMECMCEP